MTNLIFFLVFIKNFSFIKNIKNNCTITCYQPTIAKREKLNYTIFRMSSIKKYNNIKIPLIKMGSS